MRVQRISKNIGDDLGQVDLVWRHPPGGILGRIGLVDMDASVRAARCALATCSLLVRQVTRVDWRQSHDAQQEAIPVVLLVPPTTRPYTLVPVPVATAKWAARRRASIPVVEHVAAHALGKPRSGYRAYITLSRTYVELRRLIPRTPLPPPAATTKTIKRHRLSHPPSARPPYYERWARV